MSSCGLDETKGLPDCWYVTVLTSNDLDGQSHHRWGSECRTQRNAPMVGPSGLLQPHHASRFNVCCSLLRSSCGTNPLPAYLPKDPPRLLNCRPVNIKCILTLYALMTCMFTQEINYFLLHHADAVQFRSLHTLDPASSSTYFSHKTGRQDEGYWKIYE